MKKKNGGLAACRSSSFLRFYAHLYLAMPTFKMGREKLKKFVAKKSGQMPIFAEQKWARKLLKLC